MHWHESAPQIGGSVDFFLVISGLMMFLRIFSFLADNSLADTPEKMILASPGYLPQASKEGLRNSVF